MPNTLKPDIKPFYSCPPFLETNKVNLSVYIRRLETLMKEFFDTNKIKVVKSKLPEEAFGECLAFEEANGKFTVFNEFFEAIVLKEDPHCIDTSLLREK